MSLEEWGKRLGGLKKQNMRSKTKQASILGGMFLISGSCIGAGMLALPIFSGMAGFVPSFFMTILAWVFMTFTALVLVEVTSWFKTQINIVSLADKAFGNKGKAIAWSLYLFLFYSLLIAYIAGSSEIFSHLLKDAVDPFWVGLIFTIVLGWIVYLGTKTVDVTNRVLMMGLIVAYVGMIVLGIKQVDLSLLMSRNWNYLILPLPVLIVSFGFHNMIPTISAYMGGDVKKIRQTILGGSFLSLLIYLFWQALVLGVIPIEGQEGIRHSFLMGKAATQPLSYHLNSSVIIVFAKGFAFFAIITSFLAQSLGLMHFIADGMKVQPTKKNSRWLIVLTLAPPILFTLTYQNLFLKALSFAGGFCAVILFGIFPSLMAWTGRYQRKYHSKYRVIGGKCLLIIAILFSSFLALNELAKIFK